MFVYYQKNHYYVDTSQVILREDFTEILSGLQRRYNMLIIIYS